MRRALYASFFLLAASCNNATTITGDDAAVGGGADMAVPVGVKDMAVVQDMATLTNIGPKVAAGNFRLFALTTDNRAIVVDDTKHNLSAIDLATGKIDVVDPAPGNLRVQGKGVWSWSQVDMNTGVAVTTFWTAASGANQITAQGLNTIGYVADDGANIIFSSNPAPDGTSTDISIAKADGSGAKTLATSLDLSMTCFADLNFRGGKFFIIGCPPAPDGGVQTSTLWVVDAVTHAVVSTTPGLQASNLRRLVGAISAAGDKVFAIDQNGAAVVINAADGKITKIDADGAAGWMTPDGATVMYRNSKGALMSSATTNPAPKQLVANNVNDFSYFVVGTELLPGMSNDGKYMVYTENQDPTTGLGDLHLVSTTVAGSPVTLTSDPTGALFGDAFTTDSTFALYYPTTTNVAAIGGLIGPLSAVAVAAGTPKMIGDKIWLSYAAKGSIVVYNDNFYAKGAKNHGRFDLKFVDVKSGSPTMVAQNAEADFFVTADKTSIVYVFGLNTPASGLYQYKIP